MRTRLRVVMPLLVLMLATGCAVGGQARPAPNLKPCAMA